MSFGMRADGFRMRRTQYGPVHKSRMYLRRRELAQAFLHGLGVLDHPAALGASAQMLLQGALVQLTVQVIVQLRSEVLAFHWGIVLTC